MSQTDHAPAAPSSAARRGRCPGSRALEARLPNRDTEQSREGTAAHEVATHLVSTGELLAVGHICANGVPVDEAMREGAQMLAEDVIKRIGPDFNPEWLIVEKPVSAANPIHRDCWGTPDIRYVDTYRKRIRLWDYKYGHGYVDAHENAQMIEYLAGTIETDLGGWPEDDQEWTFEATIVQPREYGREGPIRRWCGRMTDLRAHFNYWSQKEAEAADHLAPTIAGPIQCKNCRAIMTCEANQRAVSHLADYVGGNVPFDPPPELVGRELTWLTHIQQMLEARISGAKAQAETFIKLGKPVPGWSMEQGQSRLKWYKPAAEVIAAIKLIAEKDVSKLDLVTPTQAKAMGIDEAVILQYAHRPPAERKLVPINYALIARKFQ